jgi:hypothetical protein
VEHFTKNIALEVVKEDILDKQETFHKVIHTKVNKKQCIKIMM